MKSNSKNDSFVNYCETVVIPKEYRQKQNNNNNNNDNTDEKNDDNDNDTSNSNLTIDIKKHPKYNENNLNESLNFCHDSLDLRQTFDKFESGIVLSRQKKIVYVWPKLNKPIKRRVKAH